MDWEDVARELLRLAREHGVTLAIFGKSRRPAWRRLIQSGPIEEFARSGSGIDVYEIETEATQPLPYAAGSDSAASMSLRRARVCSALVPQQPPTMRAPRASQRPACSA